MRSQKERMVEHMKRFLTLLLALTLCLTALTAAAAGEHFYKGTAPVVEEKTTLTMLSSNSGSLIDDISGMTWTQEMLRRANIDLDLELVPSSAYDDVLKPRLAAGVDLPDIIKVGNDQTMTYCGAGLFYDLTDLVNEIGYGVKHWTTQPGWEGLIDQMTATDGRIYYITTLHGGSLRGLVMNTKWLAEAGIDKNELTVENMDKYFHYVLENDLNGNGDATDEVPLFSRSNHIYGWGLYWGLDLYGTWQVHPETKTVTCAYIDDNYKAFLEQMHKWYQEGILYNEYMTADYDVQANINSNDRMGCQIHFTSNVDSYNTTVNPDWRYGDEPVYEAVSIVPEVGSYDAYGRTNTDCAGGFAISAKSENPEAAFAFLDYQMTPECYTLVTAGIEGVDYTIDADGTMILSDEYIANVDSFRFKQGMNNHAFPMPEVGINYLYKTNIKGLQYDFWNAHDPAKTMPALNSYFMTEEQAESISMYKTDLDTYFKENLTAFITGTRSLDTWDEYVAGAKSLNVDEVCGVYQELYNK